MSSTETWLRTGSQRIDVWLEQFRLHMHTQTHTQICRPIVSTINQPLMHCAAAPLNVDQTEFNCTRTNFHSMIKQLSSVIGFSTLVSRPWPFDFQLQSYNTWNCQCSKSHNTMRSFVIQLQCSSKCLQLLVHGTAWKPEASWLQTEYVPRRQVTPLATMICSPSMQLQIMTIIWTAYGIIRIWGF